MNPATVILLGHVLDLLIAGVSVSVKTLSKTRTLVQEGRDPTSEEWSALDAELDDARRRLHSDGPDGAINGVPV